MSTPSTSSPVRDHLIRGLNAYFLSDALIARLDLLCDYAELCRYYDETYPQDPLGINAESLSVYLSDIYQQLSQIRKELEPFMEEICHGQ